MDIGKYKYPWFHLGTGAQQVLPKVYWKSAGSRSHPHITPTRKMLTLQTKATTKVGSLPLFFRLTSEKKAKLMVTTVKVYRLPRWMAIGYLIYFPP